MADASYEDLVAALVARDRLIEAQAAQLEEQGQVIAELRTQVVDLQRRLAKDSSNSSKPPSSDNPLANRGTCTSRQPGSERSLARTGSAR